MRNPVQHILIYIWLVLCLVLNATASATPHPGSSAIHMAVRTDMPPYQFTDSSGNARGYVIDIWNLWSQATGIPVTFIPLAETEIPHALATGAIDGVAAIDARSLDEHGLSEACELIQLPVVLFVAESALEIDPAIKDAATFFRPDGALFNENLAAHLPGTLKNAAIEHAVREVIPSATLTIFDTSEQLLDALRAKEIDSFLTYKAVGEHLRAGSGAKDYKPSETIATARMVAAIPSHSTWLLDTVRSGFALIPGETQRLLLSRWVDEQDEAQLVTPLVLFGSMTFLLMLMVLTRNMILRHRLTKGIAETRKVENIMAGFLERLSKLHFMLSLDGSGNILAASHGIVLALGRPAPSVIGPFTNLLPPSSEDPVAWDSPFFERELLHADGSARTFEFIVVPVEGDGPVHVQALALDVTDRIEARRTNELIQQRYRNILDSAPIAIFRMRSNGTLIAVNGEMARLWGYQSPEQMMASETAQAFSLCSCVSKEKELRALMDDAGHVSGKEVVCRTRHGRIFTGLVSARQLVSPDGSQCIDGFVLDISELKQAQEQLRNTSRRLADIIDFLPDATLVISATGHIIAWNRAIERLTGVPAAQMLGKGEFEYAVPFYGERMPLLHDYLRIPTLELPSRYKVIERSERGIVAEVSLPRLQHGCATRMWIAASALTDEDGTITAVIQSLRDVTDRKREIDELANSRNRYQMALEATNEGIWECDVTAQNFYSSPRCLDIIGSLDITPSPYLLHDLSTIMHPDDQLQVMSVAQSVASGRADRFTIECRIRQASGGWRWVLGRGVVRRNSAGGVERVIGSIADITERKQSEIISSILLQISNAVNVTHDLDSLFSAIHDILRQHVPADNFYVSLVDPPNNRIEFRYYADEYNLMPPMIEDLGTSDNASPVMEVLRTGKQLRLYDQTLKNYQMPDAVPAIWLGTPILIRGKPIGAMVLRHYRDPDAFSLREAALMVSIADQVAVAIERKQNEEQLTYLALHDSLTGLPNRALLLERIERARLRAERRAYSGYAVMMIDLNRFKIINDSHGHEMGDKLLQHIAAIMRPMLRSTDTVARLGGDEFAIMLEDAGSAREIILVARRLLKAIDAPIRIDSKQLNTSASIGIVIPDVNYTSAEEILRDADIAMYQAKGRGRGRFRVFNEQMRLKALEVMTLENDLGTALRLGQFTLEYQPMFTTISRQVLGFEALVRWQHPVHGTIMPSQFIPIAEETGLIVRIGQSVLENALEALARWRYDMPEAKDLYMSVNMSARQFAQPNLPTIVRQALEKTGLPPHCLKLEITETAIMQDPTAALHRITALRDLGVGLGIDDFGTGYSSLAYLQRFPVDTLKVDRSFIVGITAASEENREIVRSVIALAHSLSLDVVAEGVETEEELAFLTQLECEAVQGFILSRPIPEDEIPARMAEWTMHSCERTATVHSARQERINAGREAKTSSKA